MNRQTRGRRAQRFGVAAEATARTALVADGWNVRASRLRTAAGEIDLIAEKEGLLAIVEVKARPRLAEAAGAIDPRKRARLLAAGAALLAAHPEWGAAGVRFDILLVDAAGAVRRIIDALREE